MSCRCIICELSRASDALPCSPNVQSWKDFAKRWSFDKFGVKLKLSAITDFRDFAGTHAMLRIDLEELQDTVRQSDQPLDVSTNFPVPLFESDEQATKITAKLVEYVMMHELRECMLLDGKKVHQEIVDRQHNSRLKEKPGVMSKQLEPAMYASAP